MNLDAFWSQSKYTVSGNPEKMEPVWHSQRRLDWIMTWMAPLRL
jgi:hypothetical protein